MVSGWTGHLEVKECLLNNRSDYGSGNRFSNTSELSKYYDQLRAEAIDLIQQLKPILLRVGPAYDVLESLAEMPCALRRCQGKTWEEIEEEIQVVINEEDKLELALSEVITLNQISECTTT